MPRPKRKPLSPEEATEAIGNGDSIILAKDEQAQSPTKPACDIFTDRREFLLASVSDDRKPFWMNRVVDQPPYYGLAISLRVFKLALMERLHPNTEALSKRDIQKMITEDWQAQTED